MRGLADLTGRFTLSFCVGVAYGLANEQNEQDRQGKSYHPCTVTSLVVPANHLDALGYPNLPFDARAIPS